MIRNLSAALTLLARQEAAEFFGHEDISAFGAPGECHRDFDRGAGKRWRLVYRQVHSLTRLSWKAFVRRLRREHGMSIHCNDRQYGRIVGRILNNNYR